VEIAADAPNEWGGAPVRHLDGEPDPETIDCIIATSDGGGIEQLRVWNEYAVLHSLRFYPIVLQDLVGYIGPLYVPGQTACYECLRLRQNAHLVDYANRRIVESAFIHSQSVSGFHPAMASILGSIAAIELTKAFGLAPALTRAGTLIEVNLIGSEMTSRRVLRLPRCPVCSRLNRAPSPSLPAARLAPAGERQER
jgi:thiazole/oxazole-forming peptide maturase SagC family component